MAEIGDDVFFATIPELNARLKDKAFSAEDLARAFAKRLADLGPRYNALALPLNQEAIRRAQEVDKELKRGRFRGPLQGIPYGVKDLISYKGQPTTWGAKPYAGTGLRLQRRRSGQTGRRRRGDRREALDRGTGWGRRIPVCFGIADWSRAESLGSYAAGRVDPRADPARQWRPDWYPSRSARKPPARS